jgi:hypothetical protein
MCTAYCCARIKLQFESALQMKLESRPGAQLRMCMYRTVKTRGNTSTMFWVSISESDLSSFFRQCKIQTLFRNLAPAHKTGAKWVDMLKPNNDANHRIAVTASGTSRSSVWWRKGRAL